MCLLNSVGLSKLSSVTMDVSLITLPPASSSCRMSQLWMSCPYTSPQNGKAEHIIRSVNNVICTLLIQASLPRRYWTEGLHTTTYMLNCLPTMVIQAACPHLALFSSAPSYLSDHPGFIEAKSNTSLFIFRHGSDTVYLLLYVDDIILTASSTKLLHRTIFTLQREFTMKDLGSLHHFLGITVERRPDGLFLHQRTYTLDILKCVVVAHCKPCTTPVNLQVKLAGDSGPPVEDASQFRSITRALQYLTFT
jgi:hypothetical protein